MIRGRFNDHPLAGSRTKWFEVDNNLTDNAEVEDMIWSIWRHIAAGNAADVN